MKLVINLKQRRRSWNQYVSQTHTVRQYRLCGIAHTSCCCIRKKSQSNILQPRIPVVNSLLRVPGCGMADDDGISECQRRDSASAEQNVREHRCIRLYLSGLIVGIKYSVPRTSINVITCFY
jgi:hypothetical protein